MHRTIVGVFAVICPFGSLAAAAEPAALSKAGLIRTAEAAGFQVREAMIDSADPIRPRLPFQYFEYDDPALAALREKYGLEKVVAGAKDEWTAQLLLKQWLFQKIPGGNPRVDATSAMEILDYASKGEKFYCSHYAAAYVECAQALGWSARKLGIDRKHGPEELGSSHHGVAEVWSNQHRKWAIIDPQSNLHFEKRGNPLSAWEIRAEWLKDQGAAVDHVIGVPPNTTRKKPAIVWWTRADEDETATYFWMYVHTRSDALSERPDAKFILPQDDASAGLIWYQNDYAAGRSRPHRGYIDNVFQPTRRIQDAYWTVCVVEPRLVAGSDRVIRMSLDSYCPNRTGYEAGIDDGKWEAIKDPTSMAWPLKKGWNTLRLRTICRRGVVGPETTAILFLE